MEKEILEKIKESLESPVEGRNSMGASENYYNPYYMIGKCFTEDELINMELTRLKSLIRLAEFASEVFY